MEERPKKISLLSSDGDLSIYIFTVTCAGGIGESLKVIMAHNDGLALNELKKHFPAGMTIHAQKRGSIPMQELLDKVVLETPTHHLPVLEEPAPKEKTAQNFIHGLMLIADRYVTDETDKESLKKIISKIEYANESEGENAGLDSRPA